MADLAIVESAFMKAHAAGDTESASVLAAEVKRLRSQAAPSANNDLPTGAIAPQSAILAHMGRHGVGLPMVGSLNDALDRGANYIGGLVTDAGAAMGASPTVSAGAGTLANTAVQAVPMVAGGEMAKGFALQMEKAGRWLMTKAVKPSTLEAISGEGAQAVQTLLDKGISVSKGGVEKVREMIRRINEDIGSKITDSPATINMDAVAQRLGATMAKALDSPFATEEIAKTNAIENMLRSNPTLPKIVPEHTVQSAILDEGGKPFSTVIPASGTNEISVQRAQRMKQIGNQRLADTYGEFGSIERDARKQYVRGLKEEVASKVPGIAELNAQDSALYNALDPLERRVAVAARSNPLGISPLAHNWPTWLAFMADRNPHIASLLARAIYSGSEQIPANLTRGALAAATINQPKE